MRIKLLTSGLIVIALVVAIVASIGAGGAKGGSYQVRAVFKDAANITTGGDVRVAGANVGTIKSIYVSNGDEASVILNITDPAFQKFYADAKCRIRLQSLIGEKFVDCDPGTPTEPPLKVDPTDKDRHVIYSQNTGSPVDIDQLLDAMREPQRERFRVIINELGVTLTGRGQDLQDILLNFNPTFEQVDNILKILAKDNKELVTLAVDGDTALKTFAENRKHVTGLFKNADLVNRAVNTKQQQLAETLQKIPGFLDQLEPTARELKTFSEQAAPVAKSARESASNLSTFVSGTKSFVDAADPALTKFGKSADAFRAQIPAITPVAADLNAFASNRSSITNIKKLLQSFEKQGGYANLATLTIGLVGAENGKDSFGHFLRSALALSGSCIFYSAQTNSECGADFTSHTGTGNVPPSTSKSASTSASSSSAAAATSNATSPDAAALNYLLGSGK